MAPPSILNNPRLNESPILASEYNSLPSIKDMQDAGNKHAQAHAILLALIAAEGLADDFNLHLIHKHFDIDDGRVMVYGEFKRHDHNDFFLSRPEEPAKYPHLRGLYFKAAPGGMMDAYEYTTEPGKDLSGHADFVKRFSDKVFELGVQDVFALTAVPVSQRDQRLTEIEMASVNGTVLVKDPSWIPNLAGNWITGTDWHATEWHREWAETLLGGDRVAAPPGAVQLVCYRAPDDAHADVTCSRTRQGTHLGHNPGPDGERSAFVVNGVELAVDSPGHAIMKRVVEVMAVGA